MTNYFSGKRDVYIEIAQRYIEYIRLGVLREGDRLPSVRVAAGELGVNPNTVQRAYVYLEELGMIRLLPKKGAYVTGSVRQEARQNPAALDAIMALKKSGIDKEAVLRAVEEVYCDD